MKLALLTAVWGRPRLTDMVLNYYDRLVDKGVIDEVIYVWSKEDETLDPDLGLHDRLPNVGWLRACEYANSPLSDKWNWGMLNVRLQKPDAVMIVGSDDLVTPNYIEDCKYLIEHGAEYIYLPGCYFYETTTRRMFWGYAQRLGLGRVLSRSLLDRMDWQVWPADINSGLDGAMWQKVQALKDPARVVFLREEARKHGYIGLDIKTGENIWGFDSVRDNLISFDVDAEKILHQHFPSVADELLNWEAVAAP